MVMALQLHCNSNFSSSQYCFSFFFLLRTHSNKLVHVNLSQNWYSKKAYYVPKLLYNISQRNTSEFPQQKKKTTTTKKRDFVTNFDAINITIKKILTSSWEISKNRAQWHVEPRINIWNTLLCFKYITEIFKSHKLWLF